MFDRVETEGFVLEKRSHGSRATKLLVFSEQFGLIYVYHRIKADLQNDFVDIFDLIMVIGEMKRDTIMFADEYLLIRSNKCVVRDYESYMYLSKVFLLIKKISEPGLQSLEIFALIKRFFTKIISGESAIQSSFRLLYLLCRLEGVNVNDFFQKLDLNIQRTMLNMLQYKNYCIKNDANISEIFDAFLSFIISVMV